MNSFLLTLSRISRGTEYVLRCFLHLGAWRAFGSEFSPLLQSGVSISFADLFLFVLVVGQLNQEAKVERRPDAAILSMASMGMGPKL